MSALEFFVALLWWEARSDQERLEEPKMLSLEKRWLVGATLEAGSHPAGGVWRSGGRRDGLAPERGCPAGLGRTRPGPLTLGAVSHLR